MKKNRYYLDIYHNGERYTESLDLYQLVSKHPLDAENNRQNKDLAENIRAKRQLELESEHHGIQPRNRTEINFVEYFEDWVRNYHNKDIRLAKACYAHFLKYIEEKGLSMRISSRQITPDFARNFQRYLMQHLNGETPYNYFRKFIKLCIEATEANIFRVNPCKGIKNKPPEGLKKDILSLEEIARLKEAACPHEEVKRAFLLSLNTGLRWVDVEKLCWRDIDGDMLRITQSKTGRQVVVYLNKTAQDILQPRGHRDERVFTLPSTSYVTRVLRAWVANAGIDKHISWHCARHSFAVNLLAKNTDIKSVSSLLGHATLKHTEIYTRVVDELKKQAVANIDV